LPDDTGHFTVVPLMIFVTVAARCLVALCHAVAHALTLGTESTREQARTASARFATKDNVAESVVFIYRMLLGDQSAERRPASFA